MTARFSRFCLGVALLAGGAAREAQAQVYTCIGGHPAKCGCDGALSAQPQSCSGNDYCNPVGPGFPSGHGPSVWECFTSNSSCDGSPALNLCAPSSCGDDDPKCCKDRNAGDPVDLANGFSLYQHEDLRLATSLGPLSLLRAYTSAPDSWSQNNAVTSVPKPFGSSNLSATGMRWWHNLYSFVVPGSTIRVYSPTGQVHEYGQPAGGSCWAQQTSLNQLQRNRLCQTGGGYQYYDDESGRRYVYNAVYYGPDLQTRYFLSEVQNPGYVPVLKVTYGLPAVGGCPPPDAGSTTGVPYISTIDATGGGRWSFVYKKLSWPGGSTECVIDRITGAGPSGEEELIRYEYLLDGGVEMPGFLRGANWVTASQAYTYAPEYFIVDGGSAATSTIHYYTAGQVSRDVSATSDLQLSFDGNWTVVNAKAGCGNEANACTQASQQFVPISTGSSYHRHSSASSCGGGSSCSGGGAMQWVAFGDSGRSGYLTSRKDKLDNFIAYDVHAPDAGVPSVLTERQRILYGATTDAGANALETTRLFYSYGPNIEQRVSEKHRDSLLAAGQEVVLSNFYDAASNRLARTLQTGYTIVDGGVVSKTVGTFYLPDAIGRTSEVHGPCFVSSGATDCTSGEEYPVTKYTYDAPDGGFLQKISKCTSGASGACTTSLDTTFNAHDARGNVTSETDPNGVVTTRTFTGGLLTSETVTAGTQSWTTAFGYDNGVLTYRLSPQGWYEVFCYRNSAVGSCSTSDTWLGTLTWKAKAATSTGGSWKEATDYTYWPDGTINTERTLLPGPVVRTVRKYAADAHGRLTWQGYGGNQGVSATYALKRAYDSNDNQSSLGLPYNAAPDYCASDSNHKCLTMSRDRTNRLSTIVEYPSSSQASQTCFGHDAHGNITKVVGGINGTSTPCLGSDGKLNTSLDTSMAASYVYDDFGNMVTATPPNSESFSYEYDARGNQIIARAHVFSSSTNSKSFYYDLLDRPTRTQLNASFSGTLVEAVYSYDGNGGSPGTGCPSLTNTSGRARRVDDSFGSTFFSYDGEGRILNEVRFRADAGSFNCSSGTVDDHPITSYGYTAGGELATIVYPHGRTVTYSYYGSGANYAQDRIQTVSVLLADAGTINVITNAQWEPYGGLKAYELQAPLPALAADKVALVEYLRGGSTNTVPSLSCTVPRPDDGSGNDHTGRLAAVWVSRSGLDGGSGDVYKRTYSWVGDQVNTIDNCVLNNGSSFAPRREQYTYADGGAGYDQTLRLQAVSRPSGQYDSTGGAVGQRIYGYDTRGNRTSETDDCWTPTLTYSTTTGLKDQLDYRIASAGNFTAGVYYQYDPLGRVYQMTWSNDSYGWSSHWITFTLDPTGVGYYGNNDLTSAYTSAVIQRNTASAGYEYFYDYRGRRRLKTLPVNSVSDEFFYSAISDQMLEDRGSASLMAGAPYPIDEYLWLDGRPVAFIRSGFNSSWQRQPDFVGSCNRNDESQNCGIYFLVTDHIGKPVLAIDSNRKVAGVADYDPFGHANRAVYWDNGQHPYAANTNTILGYLRQVPGPNVTAQLRAQFFLMDTEGCGTNPVDYAYLTDQNGSALNSVHYGGHHQGQTWSDWVTVPSDGWVDVRFSSNGSSLAPNSSGCPTGASGFNYTGAVLQGYEYRRYETGGSPMWTPLRFPGQYYDAELDLFENWHRYYDPSIGRYLQPEPVVARDPARGQEQTQGMPYSYVRSNPVSRIDPTGLFIRGDGFDCPNYFPALKLARERAGCDAECATDAQERCRASFPSGTDLCITVQDHWFPEVNVVTTTQFYGHSSGDPHLISFSHDVCFSKSIDLLAATMLHEAAHFSQYTFPPGPGASELRACYVETECGFPPTCPGINKWR